MKRGKSPLPMGEGRGEGIMRILIFSTAYFPHVGGAEVAVKEITDRLSHKASDGKPEVDFDMITVRLDSKDAKQEKIGNINVYRIGWGLGRINKLLFPFRASRLASKLHKKEKYDIIWSIMASFSGFAALFFKKKNPEVKFLLTLQEGDDLREPERKAWLVKNWFKQIFTKADYIQCISNYLADWARKMNANCPVEVVPNGVTVGKSQIPIRQLADKSQRNFKLQIQNSKVILTTSRLVKKNGVEDLIIAFSKLLRLTTYDSRLIICGDGEEKSKLEKLIKKLDVADRVEFKGFVEPAELSEYYAIADVFCRPSLSEGLGISFLEAMAYSVPVVATNVGGIKDFLKHKETGYVCEVNNPESIAEQIKYILDPQNRDEVEGVKRSARQMVIEKYNWGKIAPQMRNIFLNVIASEVQPLARGGTKRSNPVRINDIY